MTTQTSGQTPCQPSAAPTIPLVVLTDLDGTLLDHHTYSADAAKPALKTLKQLGIPVIFNTSKTRDEVIGLRQQLDNHDPFVCENGSAVFLPRPDQSGYNPEILGASYQDILKALHQLRAEGFRFRGFNDMPASEVAALTGLSLDEAHLAKQRHASEPLVWTDSDEARQRFTDSLTHFGLHATQGGRFLHVMGNTDKASGLEFFRHYYAHCWKTNASETDASKTNTSETKVLIAALGDGENDRHMLEQADYPIVIPGAKGTLELTNPNAVTAHRPGPDGWNTCINTLLEQLKKEPNRG